MTDQQPVPPLPVIPGTVARAITILAFAQSPETKLQAVDLLNEDIRRAMDEIRKEGYNEALIDASIKVNSLRERAERLRLVAIKKGCRDDHPGYFLKPGDLADDIVKKDGSSKFVQQKG